jgi:hypothetical protein
MVLSAKSMSSSKLAYVAAYLLWIYPVLTSADRPVILMDVFFFPPMSVQANNG